MTLSTIQWIVIGIGFAVLAALIFGIMQTRARITWRRSITLVFASGVFGAAFWLLSGGSVAPGRHVTFVAHCRSNSDLVDSAIRRLLPGGSGHTLLLFDTEARPCPAAVALHVGGPVEQVVPVRANQTRDLLSLSGATAPKSTLSAIRRIVATETIIFLHDRALADWNHLGLADRVVDRAAMEAFSGEIFLADLDGSDREFNVSFSLGPGFQQGQGFWRQDVVVDLSVVGGPVASGTVPDTLSVDLCFSRNRTASFDDCNERDSSKLPPADRFLLEGVTLVRQSGLHARWRWFPNADQREAPTLGQLLGGLDAVRHGGLGAATVSPGWQFIQARIRLRGGADAGLVLPPATAYFDAKGSGPMLMLGPPVLAGLAWPRPPPNPVQALMVESWGDQESRRLRALPPVAQVPGSRGVAEGCILDSYAPRARIEACAEIAGALVVIEPDAALIDLLTKLDLPRRLAIRGIPTVVAAPPLQGTTAAPWMPAWAVAASGRGRLVRRITRSIVMIADCSGLAQMPLDNDVASMMDRAALRPSDLQKTIIERFVAALTTIPGTVALPVEQRGGRDIVLRLESTAAWHPAIQVETDPGCLRARDPALRTARALVETAGVAERIDAFLGRLTRSAAPFAAFEPGELHLGSVVVIFSTAAAQVQAGGLATVRTGGATLAGHLPVDHTTGSVDERILRNLRQAGVRILLVSLPTSKLFSDAADAAALASGRQTWAQALANWRTEGLVELLDVPRGQSPIQTAAALIAALGLEPPTSVPVMATTVLRGRSLDPRMPQEIMAAPSVVIGLQPEPEAETLISGATSSVLGAGPLAVARYDLGAPVIALAWQPFDLMAWASDDLARARILRAMHAACSGGCPLIPWIRGNGDVPGFGGLQPRGSLQSSGLGIQRLIDAIDHSARRGGRVEGLELVQIQLKPAQDAADFRFRIAAGSTNWTEPRLTVDTPRDHCGAREANSSCPLQLIEIDPNRGEAIYRFSTTSPGGLSARGEATRASLHELVLGSATGDRISVPLRLVPRDNLVSGGAPFENLARVSGALTAVGAVPEARRSAATAVMFSLLLAILTLYSPLIRRWHAFNRFFRRRRRQLAPVSFDTEIVSERVGHQLQRTEASRRSGDPAWMRPFQAGDSLSRARIADLLGLTSAGAALGLTPKRPQMRLREIGESSDVVIGVDDSPSLLHPGDFTGLSRKRAAVEALVAVVATAVHQRGGRLSVVGLRSTARIERMTSRDPDSVAKLLAAFFDPANGRAPVLSSLSLSGTAPRLLISDFLSLSLEQYVEWIGSGGGAILIRDDAQADEIGLGHDPATGAVYDRSMWERRDIVMLLQLLRLEARHAVEHAGGVFAEVAVDATDAEVAEILMASGVLGLGRR